ncbi:MAG: radical SAM protein [Sedimentisphaerales bacterium]|nr:radical SAM protein [Sedimentisphaerales bacterium]
MNSGVVLKDAAAKTPTYREADYLPIMTKSLCPECLAVIDAKIVDYDGMVFMEKRCANHGPYRELISTDAKFYNLIISRDLSQSRQVSNPIKGKQDACPNGCGICSEHLSLPIMMNIDLTNRCNLNCPFCFANSNKRGELIELSIEQVSKMIDAACAVDEVQPVCFQFTGGEPTVHPQFLEALAEAKKHKFTQVQAATNGIKFAEDADLAVKASEAGLNVAYLQFDGVDDKIYVKTRGRALLDIKLKAIDNLYKASVRTVLVPTIVKGVNDSQIGEIIRFAVKNIDKIIGISWQPVSFTGRVDYQQRLTQRFTISDLVREIEEQTGGWVDRYRDWYPFGFGDPFARLLELVRGKRHITIGCSPNCGVITYVVVDPVSGKIFPIPSFVDVDTLMGRIASAVEKFKSRKGWPSPKRKIFRNLSIAQELRSLKSCYKARKGPKGWSFADFVDFFMMDFADFSDRYANNEDRVRSTTEKPYKVLLMASMHFQDVYNYQIDRVNRCVVHYTAADGRIYPFCSYNSGPCHRNRVEKQFAVRIDQYAKQV